MNLPFTQQQFFEVFARYNEAVMPLQIGVSAYGALVVRGRDFGRAISLILAGLWTWIAVVYHFMYFRELNPAALFAWAGVVRGRMVFGRENRARRIGAAPRRAGRGLARVRSPAQTRSA